MSPPAEYSRLFRADDIAPLECLDAHYVTYAFAPHLHEDYVIGMVSAGVERYRYRGTWHYATPGTLALLNPGEVHTGEAVEAEGWRYRVFYAAPAMLDRVAAEVSGQPDARAWFDARRSVIDDPELAGQLAALHAGLADSTDRLARQSGLYQAFATLVARHMAVRPAPLLLHRPALDTARQLLADRLADNLSLDELAGASGLSPYHLSRSFAVAFGLPPVAWRNQLRVARARTLLARGGRPAEVATELGFADQAHLTRAFRLALGVTPAAYQRAVGARSFKTGDGC
ncbi:AraC family transcriptional regulator [Pseudogulbenkiania sp. MAI-1]|uniref:AraC family transcriptional regulator n=1 Tax=Pseudogulbenkiania sp. MAI-1 TaxID=990370 RepID=UPI00045EB723|nr:AraC family transcriptional regulator [Pseudogulbenkiania sp. MAI-1]